jgi:hypothetical protein
MPEGAGSHAITEPDVRYGDAFVQPLARAQLEAGAVDRSASTTALVSARQNMYDLAGRRACTHILSPLHPIGKSHPEASKAGHIWG